MTYPAAYIQQCAVFAIKARARSDMRWVQLVETLARHTGLTQAQVCQRIELLALGGVP